MAWWVAVDTNIIVRQLTQADELQYNPHSAPLSVTIGYYGS
ncbi:MULTISPECIES: hypothetical protein [Fischerella]|nr:MULTISPECIES: hypothetical protein [Fischerella]